jgi:hypothetical protein
MSAVLQHPIDPTEILREPGTSQLSPQRAAALLDLDLAAIAEALGVHRNTMRLHPDGRRTQEQMRDLNRIFQALLQQKADPTDAAFHLKNTPIRVLGNRTLFEAFKAGDTEKALRYLQTTSSGQNG